MIYAGFGARDTPPDVLALMERIASVLDRQGWTLQTGGAVGADAAFARGATAPRIFLPWHDFNGWKADGDLVTVADTPALRRLAAQHHPAWTKCSAAAKALHARNGAILQGASLGICWSPGGRVVRGTGQGLRIAQAMGVPVLNLGAVPMTVEDVSEYAVRFAV